MRYSLENEAGQVKTFSFDETQYELICSHDCVIDKQVLFSSEELDITIGDNTDKVSEYIAVFEGDRPFGLSHFTAFAIGTLELFETVYAFNSGSKIPEAYMPMPTVINDKIKSQILVSELNQSGTSISPNTFNSILIPYDPDNYFYDSFTEDVTPFFNSCNMEKAFGFYFANRCVTDFAAIRQYGFNTMWFINSYEESARVKVKIYKRTLTDSLEVFGT